VENKLEKCKVNVKKIYLTRQKEDYKEQIFKSLYYIRPGYTIYGERISVKVPLKKRKKDEEE